MTHGSLFSGIGAPDLAAEWMGWDNIFHCEINPFGQKILKYYWPNSISYDNIKTTDFSIHRGQIDVLTGGFPCQPYSLAGLRKGKEDERHLWPEMLRAIREVRPRWVVGENVLGLVDWNDGLVFEEVQSDLENEGYQIQPYILPASGVDSPHQRYRVYFIAYANSQPRSQPVFNGNNGEGGFRNKNKKIRSADRKFFEVASVFDPVLKEGMDTSESTNNYDGFPSELDGITIQEWTEESLRAAGNSIVPQLIYNIFKSIEAYEEL